MNGHLSDTLQQQQTGSDRLENYQQRSYVGMNSSNTHLLSSPDSHNQSTSSSPGSSSTSGTVASSSLPTSSVDLDACILNLSRRRIEMAQIAGRQAAAVAAAAAIGQQQLRESAGTSSGRNIGGGRGPPVEVQQSSDPRGDSGGTGSTPTSNTTDLRRALAVARQQAIDPNFVNRKLSMGGAKTPLFTGGRDMGLLGHEHDQQQHQDVVRGGMPSPALSYFKEFERRKQLTGDVAGGSGVPPLFAKSKPPSMLDRRIGSFDKPQQRQCAQSSVLTTKEEDGAPADLLRCHQIQRDEVDYMMKSLLLIRQRQEEEIQRLSREQEQQQKKEDQHRKASETRERNKNAIVGVGSEWHICKHCQAKAFSSKEDAEEHEAVCPSKEKVKKDVVKGRGPRNFQIPIGQEAQRPSKISGVSHQFMGKSLPAPHQVKHIPITPNRDCNIDIRPWTTMTEPPQPISIPLSTPQDQALGLSPFHCFVRRHCVQVFTVLDQEPKFSFNSKLIGLRCPYCHVDSSIRNETPIRGSVYYPSSLSDIFKCTNSLLKNHVSSCPSVPMAVAKCFRELLSKPGALDSGCGRREDWVNAARFLGLGDVAGGGVKFLDKRGNVGAEGSVPMHAPHASDIGNSKVQQQGNTSNNDCYNLHVSASYYRKTNSMPRERGPFNHVDKITTGGEMPATLDTQSRNHQQSNQPLTNNENQTQEHKHKTPGNITNSKKVITTSSASPSNTTQDNPSMPIASLTTKDDSKKDSNKTDEEKQITPPIIQPPSSASLVMPSDSSTTTSFSYCLLAQMRRSSFTEADRLGKRKGLPVGFAGLACRHCYGGYGAGRFFPSTLKTLSDTSKTLDVLHKHMVKCRKCPPEVREGLDKLREKHDEERARMKFGSQKAFFAKIWERLHGKSDDSLVVSCSNNSGTSIPSENTNECTTEVHKTDFSHGTSDGFAALSVAAALHMAVLQNSKKDSVCAKRKASSEESTEGPSPPEDEKCQQETSENVAKRARAA